MQMTLPNITDTPRLGAQRLHPVTRMENEGFSPDEIASVLTFVTRRHVEPRVLGADSYTPMDEYTGGVA